MSSLVEALAVLRVPAFRRYSLSRAANGLGGRGGGRLDFTAIREGVAFVWRRQVLLGAMTLDMFAVLFACPPRCHCPSLPTRWSAWRTR